MLYLVFVVALCAGVGIAVQMPITAIAAQRIGLSESLLVVNIMGLATVVLILFLKGGGSISAWRTLPWYVYLAGPIGIGVMAAIAFAIPRIGISSALTLSIAAQLIVGAILDQIGFLGLATRTFEWPRLIGAGIITFGVWLVIR
jgi:bacterial/archaeal transporter family-2 protein